MDIQTKTFEIMDLVFHHLEKKMLSKPETIDLSEGRVYRYKEKNIYQAILLKLARVQSLLKASLVLLTNGFLIEQAIIHRAIDETNEDILFLVWALIENDITELHLRFLDYFWEEEIDESGNMIDSVQKRGMISRQKIHAYLSRIEEDPKANPSKFINISRTLSKSYSGFVHGASPQIMDMYIGNPPHFHRSGMLNTYRFIEHADDFWNYLYRTFLSHISVAKVWGLKKHVEILNIHKTELDEYMKNRESE